MAETMSPISEMPSAFPSLFHQGPPSESSSHSSRSHPPRHLDTAPQVDINHSNVKSKPRGFKRIAVFCDGTWENGVADVKRSAYTNVLRLARSVYHEDPRDEGEPPIMQVVFYQSGIGSDDNLYSKYVEGSTGSSLGDKVEQAYAFIAHNFNPGDEIFIFGFSRGAYTARMIAMFIGAIGILTRTEMDNFAKIFNAFQKLDKCMEMDIEEKVHCEEILAGYRNPDSEGHKRAKFGKDKFTVKCVGVWDTVGSLGLPREIPHHEQEYKFFGFPDCRLGEHIEAAYQALAIDEMREDFDCTKFIQTPEGKANGQTLKQTWFSGCHADIGGGYHDHDLADLSLTWMAANVERALHLDTYYLQRHIIKHPIAPWGAQVPHDSRTGIFKLAQEIRRALPMVPDPATHETIHLSVLDRINLHFPAVAAAIKAHPSLVADLQPLEIQIREDWPYCAQHPEALEYTSKLAAQKQTHYLTLNSLGSWFNTLVRSVSFQSISSFHSTRWGGRSLSASISSNSTELTDVEGVNDDVHVMKNSSVTFTSIANGNVNGGKMTQVNTVVKSATVVIHSPTS